MDKARSKPARDVRTEPRTPLDFATVGPFQLGPLDTIILYLWLAERAVERRFHLDMGSHSSRVAALTLISANPGTNQKVLGEALGRDKSTLSVALRDLEREGLLTRTRSASDARASAIWLTAEGTAKFKALQSGMRRLDAELERIVGNDRDILLETLKKIAIGLSGDERS